jgi:hypothetical protein
LPPQEIRRKVHSATHLSASEFSALTAMTEMWSNAYLINLTSSKHISLIGTLQIRLPCKYSSLFWGTVAKKKPWLTLKMCQTSAYWNEILSLLFCDFEFVSFFK